jgi:hypothetical protein
MKIPAKNRKKGNNKPRKKRPKAELPAKTGGLGHAPINTAEALEVQARRLAVYRRVILEGESVPEAAQALDIDRTTAWRYLNELLEDAIEEEKDLGKRYKHIHRTRATKILSSLLPLVTIEELHVLKGTPDGGVIRMEDFERVTKAADSAVKVMNFLAKLDGCFAPVQVEDVTKHQTLEEARQEVEERIKGSPLAQKLLVPSRS